MKIEILILTSCIGCMFGYFLADLFFWIAGYKKVLIKTNKSNKNTIAENEKRASELLDRIIKDGR